MAAQGRYLIVNADDFGMSPGVNRGIIEAHEHGIVTSASLMVRWPAAAAAAAYATAHADLSIGLHIDLGEWTFGADGWVRLYDVTPSADGASAQSEIDRQLSTFRQLMGRNPTHLDSHQHVHLEEPVRTVAARIAADLHVPLRGCTDRVRYCGAFYGQSDEGEPFPEGVSVGNLVAIIAGLPEGITELGCHAGIDPALQTMYRGEREQEVRTLCDPRVRNALSCHEVKLLSFAGVPRGAP